MTPKKTLDVTTLQNTDPFARDYEDQSLRSLYRKMKKTAFARFECATRMRRHQNYSLWSISIFSTGLILFPLIVAFGIPIHVSVAWFNIMQVGLALMVLVLSLLISANNAGDKAEKMHRCGLELNILCHEALPYCRSEAHNGDVYESFRQRYAQILAVYENHGDIDYDVVRIKLSDEYKLSVLQCAYIRLRYAMGFIIYPLLMLVLAAALWITLSNQLPVVKETAPVPSAPIP